MGEAHLPGIPTVPRRQDCLETTWKSVGDSVPYASKEAGSQCRNPAGLQEHPIGGGGRVSCECSAGVSE
ncbi:hypothetical protein D3OALGA1CA_975 [Olavius algarvensis associated proteobacterium Delta 3]|nr:hypothetical protein D3OALGA1CA_975 [Olavius algarvensis associated proteobacterium Delta 3]CAB5130071.1 hypothetical protein D3OALGB2SA_3562 [Olavius algarvensis associated proteobacterium Delta 3]